MTTRAAKATKTQVDRYRAAVARLVTALDDQSAARAAFDAAKDAHEDARRRVLLGGSSMATSTTGNGERPSAEYKEATLTQAVQGEALALRQARERLRAAETELEKARAHERAEREVLRTLTGDATE